MLPRVATWSWRTGDRVVAPPANVMSVVPDITAGTGTESDETPVGGGPVGLSQSEGKHEMAVSVDGVLFRGPSHLGIGPPSIYTTSGRRYGRNPHPNPTLATFRQGGFTDPYLSGTRAMTCGDPQRATSGLPHRRRG